MGTAANCAACGLGLRSRERHVLEADLTHVRWAIDDAAVWDASVVNPGVRAFVLQRFRTQERALVGCLVPEVHHVALLPAAPVEATVAPRVEVKATQAVPVVPVAAPVAAPQVAAPRAVPPPAPKAAPRKVDVEAPVQSAEARVVEAASSWNRIWRPFLNESVGWFIGAFLILAGTFYFVADVWNDLGAEGRALLVFGGTSVWTLGFFAWAKFLFRREVTRSAGRVLKLIAALIAPLPTVALWPLATHWGLAFWPLLGVWAFVSAWLGREVARQYDPKSEGPIALSMAATAAMMGLAPLAAQLGHPILWLNLVPLLTLALLAQQGPREGREAQLFSMLAPLYLLGLFATRLQVALLERGAMPPLATLAAFGAIALTLLLELREAPARKSADPFAVVVVALQLGLAVLSGFGEAPAFFVTCAMGAVTTARLAQRGPSERSARWLYGTYALAYFAWQACGQLVPGALTEILASLKHALGYAPSQPLPPSYNAVYAAAFVVVVGVFALGRARSTVARLRASAPVLLRSTVVTSVLVAAMALPVVAQDARPTVFSLPFVAALCLVIAAREGRKDAAWAGALLVVLSAVGFAFVPGVPAALAFALVAALSASLAVRSNQVSKAPMSVAAGIASASAAVLAFGAAPDPMQVVALVIAAVSAMVVARETEVPMGLEGAFALLPLIPLRAVQCVHPQAGLLAVAASSVALAGYAYRRGRAAAARPVAVLFALVTVALSLLLPREVGVLLDPTLLTCAAALALANPRGWQGVVAIAVAVMSVMPMPYPCEALFASAPLALALASVGAVVSAGWAWQHGRNWHAGMLAFCSSVLVVAGAVTVHPALQHDGGPHWLVAAAVLLVAGRALLPSLTLPFAVLALLPGIPLGLTSVSVVAVAVAALGLVERWTWGRAHLLGGSRLAWSASVCATLVGLGALGLAASGSHPAQSELVALALGAVLVPLLSISATRSPFPGLVLAPALGVVAAMMGAEDGALLAPLLVLLVSRTVASSASARRVLGLDGAQRASALQWMLAVPLAAVVMALKVFVHVDLVPGVVAVALCAAAPLSLRLVLAGLMLLLAPPMAAVGALVLVAAGFLMLHAPGLAKLVFGVEPDETARPTVAFGALTLAAFAQLDPSHPAFSAAVLPVTLVAAALLLRQAWLVGPAVVACAVPFSVLFHGHSLDLDVERALAVAVGTASLAAALTWASAGERVRAAVKFLSGGAELDLRPALFWGTVASSLLATVTAPHFHGSELGLGLMLVAGLLGITRTRYEAATAAALLGLGAVLAAPAGWEGASLAAVGLALCAGGAYFDAKLNAARAFHFAGLAMSVLAIGLCGDLRHPGIALTWAAACASAWVAVRKTSGAQWVGWVASLATAHVVLFWAGLTFSHGDPKELILPWVATASLGLAAFAVAGADQMGRKLFGYGATLFGLFEMLVGLVVISNVWPREAAVATVGLAAVVWALGRRAAKEDSKFATLLAQASVAVLWAVWHVLGFGGHKGTIDAVALLALGIVANGLAVFAAREEKAGVASMLTLGAFGWPVLGLGFVLDGAAWHLGLVLLAMAAHYAWMAQSGDWKRTASVSAAAAFNLALLTMWSAAGLSSAYYLLIVAGLSVVVLVKLFEADLGEAWSVRLRATAAAAIYAAAAWKPLAFDTTWALWVCVLVCVLGVAAGIALRVRSYVYLGTAFLVTSVLSNLVRFGVREPRVGALLLSTLGLLVVAFMVMVTTRKSELVQRYRQVQSMLQAWEG